MRRTRLETSPGVHPSAGLPPSRFSRSIRWRARLGLVFRLVARPGWSPRRPRRSTAGSPPLRELRGSGGREHAILLGNQGASRTSLSVLDSRRSVPPSSSAGRSIVPPALRVANALRRRRGEVLLLTRQKSASTASLPPEPASLGGVRRPPLHRTRVPGRRSAEFQDSARRPSVAFRTSEPSNVFARAGWRQRLSRRPSRSQAPAFERPNDSISTVGREVKLGVTGWCCVGARRDILVLKTLCGSRGAAGRERRWPASAGPSHPPLLVGPKVATTALLDLDPLAARGRRRSGRSQDATRVRIEDAGRTHRTGVVDTQQRPWS